MRLGELLVQAKAITAEQLADALSAQAGKKLGQVLVERGVITEAQLTQTLSLQLSVPWVSLYHIDFSRQLLNRVPREFAERYCLIPIFVRHVKGQGETLYVAMDDPTNENALADVSRHANLPARPMIASATDIRSAIRVYYGEPSGPPTVEVPAVPHARPEAPPTTREGALRHDEPPSTQPAPTVPDAGEIAGPPQSQRQPPPLPAQAAGAAADEAALAASNARPERAASAASAVPEPPPSDRAPTGPLSRAERRARMARMLNLTLLDGTTISLPAKKKGAVAPDALTARDYVSALRAASHGADASEVLGETARWEPVVAALLSILLRKGLIADWEFVEELRKI